MRAAMTRRRASLAGIVTVALSVLVAACSEEPSAPTQQLAPATVGSRALTTNSSASTVDGLLWTKDVSQATASRVIGAAGGTLSIPNGIQITVPAGAVSSNVTFSVTRLPGKIVAYDFQPHGTTFAVPLQIAQPTLGTNLFKQPATASIQAAYFPGTSALDQYSGTADVSEFEPTSVTSDRAWIRFTVKHFSGYMISTGRH
jgi:hypothetical protein